MLAAYAARQDPDDPLSGLEVGELPEPEIPPGWTTVTVKAASLNHHDLWSLRGVGLPAGALPMVLGCDAAGIDEDGNEVVVHAVVASETRRSIPGAPCCPSATRGPWPSGSRSRARTSSRSVPGSPSRTRRACRRRG